MRVGKKYQDRQTLTFCTQVTIQTHDVGWCGHSIYSTYIKVDYIKQVLAT